MDIEKQIIYWEKSAEHDLFTGIRYFDIKKIGRIVRNIDYRIEVHPFSSKNLGESMFLDEIIRTGIRVA